MGFAQDLKEFTAGLQSGWKLMDDSEYRRAYIKARGGGSKGPYGLGPEEDDESLSDFEAGAKNLVSYRSKAARLGDVNLMDRIDADAIKFNKLNPNIGKGTSEFYAMGGLVGSATKRAVDDATSTEAVASNNDSNVDVPTTMSDLAVPGVDAGVRTMAARMSSGAVEADPAEGEDKLRAFAENKGAFTKEQIAAIDAIIDPDKVLPKEALSSARIAALYEYYDKKGEPDKGAEAANAVLMYDKQNSQTRGMLAMQAIQDGDYRSAAKIIADAYNYDIPGPMQIRPAVAREGEDFTVGPDGSVKAKVVQGNVTQEEINATPVQLAQMAQQLSTGQAWSQQLAQIAAQAKARGVGAPKQGAKTAAGAVPNTGELETELFNLKKQHAAATTQEEKDRIAEKHRAVYNQIFAATAAATAKGKSPEWRLNQRGITPNLPSASATATGKTGAVDADTAISGINRRAYIDMLSDKDVDTGEAIPVASGDARSEATAPARAKGRFKESMTTGEMGAVKADIRAGAVKDAEVKIGEREDIAKKFVDPVIANENISARAKGRELTTLEDAAVSISQKNNLTPTQVTRLLEQVVEPNTPIRYDGKGNVVIGNNRPIVMDGTTAKQLMAVQKNMMSRLKPLPKAYVSKYNDVVKRKGDVEGMRRYLTNEGFSLEGL